MAGKDDGATAGAGGGGHLRATHVDREGVIETLKAAFVQGTLTKDELDERVGQSFASRTYAELAAVTADIPAGLTTAKPPAPGRAQGEQPVLRSWPVIIAATAARLSASTEAPRPATITCADCAGSIEVWLPEEGETRHVRCTACGWRWRRACDHLLDSDPSARSSRIDAQGFFLSAGSDRRRDVQSARPCRPTLDLSAFQSTIGKLSRAGLRQALLGQHVDEALVRGSPSSGRAGPMPSSTHSSALAPPPWARSRAATAGSGGLTRTAYCGVNTAPARWTVTLIGRPQTHH